MRILAVRSRCFLYLFLNLLLTSPWVFAGTPTFTTFQTKIVSPNGAPLESASVSFRFTILDSVGTCVLFVEDFPGINMSGSGGIVSFSLGAGAKQYPSGVVSLYEVFNNSGSSYPCQAGGNFTPSSTERRQIVMQFNDGVAGWQTLPQMAINSVLYSNYANRADNLGAYPANDYLRPATLTSCALGQALSYSSGAFSCVAASGGGGGITNLTGTLPLSVTGPTSTPVVSMAQATASTSGYLSSGDWTAFNNKASATLAAGQLYLGNASGDITLGSAIGTGAVIVNSGAAAVSSATGALIVTGGAGVSGAIYSGGSISSGSTVQASTYLLSPQIYGSTTSAGNLSIDGTSHATKGNVLLATAGGNVGIGTANPGATLTVNGGITSAGADFSFSSAGSPTSHLFSLSNNLYLDSVTTFFRDVWGNQFGYFQSPGVLALGTFSAGAALDVATPRSAASGVAYGVRFQENLSATANNDALTALYIDPTFTDSSYTGVNHNGLIVASGNVGIGVAVPTSSLQVAGDITPDTTATKNLGSSALRWNNIYLSNAPDVSSDARLKKDVRTSDLGLDFIKSLRPVSRIWKDQSQGTTQHYGVIAQEAESAIAEAKGQDSRNVIVTHNEETDSYSVRYTELISPLIKAIQELCNDLLTVKAVNETQARQIASVEASKADQEALNVAHAQIQKLEAENAAIKSYLCAKDPQAIICK